MKKKKHTNACTSYYRPIPTPVARVYDPRTLLFFFSYFFFVMFPRTIFKNGFAPELSIIHRFKNDPWYKFYFPPQLSLSRPSSQNFSRGGNSRGLCYCKVYNSIKREKKTSIFISPGAEGAWQKSVDPVQRADDAAATGESTSPARMINFARLIIADAQAKLNVTPLLTLGQIYIET